MSSPTRRWIVLAVALVLALVTAGAFLVQRRADAAWRAMQAEIAAIETALAAQPAQRAPLWGEPGPGNAHAHYARATAQLPDDGDWSTSVLDAAEATRPPDAALRSSWQPALAALRAGAAATDVTRPVRAPGRPDPAAALLGWQNLARCAALEARAARQAGGGLEAARRLLDLCAFAADLMRGGMLIEQLIGLSMLAEATGELTEPALTALDHDALDLLATGLARLDDGLPRPDARADLLFLADQLDGTGVELPGLAAWRYGFSSRWMLGEGFTTMAACVRDSLIDRETPWPAREARLGRALAAATDDGNPVVRVGLPNLTEAERTWRRGVAGLRLLRLSIDLHRGLEPAPLRDPIGGGAIARTADADGVRFTCAPAGDGEPPTRLVGR